MKYIGIKYPVCDIPLQTGDDIVVCPDCGAPYRRHCYEKEDRYLFSDTHNTGTYWAPPTENSTAPKKDSKIVYPVYGKNSPSDAPFCSRYGSSLNRSDATSPSHRGRVPFRNDPPDYQNPYQNSGYQNPSSPTPPSAPFDPAQGDSPYQSAPNPFSPITIRTDKPIEDGIAAGKIAKFIQNNSSYSPSVLFHRRRTSRGHLSFSAFLFSGGWMLYRKMCRIGTIITTWMATLFVINTFMSLNYSSPLLMKLYEQARVSTSIYPSYEELMGVTELVYLLDPNSIILLFTPLFTLSIQTGTVMYYGFADNRLYYRYCAESIRKLKTEYPIATEYDKTLQENGGMNVSLALCLLIYYPIIIYPPNFFVWKPRMGIYRYSEGKVISHFILVITTSHREWQQAADG